MEENPGTVTWFQHYLSVSCLRDGAQAPGIKCEGRGGSVRTWKEGCNQDQG